MAASSAMKTASLSLRNRQTTLDMVQIVTLSFRHANISTIETQAPHTTLLIPEYHHETKKTFFDKPGHIAALGVIGTAAILVAVGIAVYLSKKRCSIMKTTIGG